MMNSVQSDLETDSLNLLCSDISNTVEHAPFKAYRVRQKSFKNDGCEGVKCLEKKTSIKRLTSARNDSRTKSVGALVEQKSWIIEAESLDGAIATLASQLGIDFEKLMSNPSCRVFYRDGSGIFLNYLPFLDSLRRKHTLH